MDDIEGQMIYKKFDNLSEVAAEWERLKLVEYAGDALDALNDIHKVFPGFIPVSEEEIFYRHRGLKSRGYIK